MENQNNSEASPTGGKKPPGKRRSGNNDKTTYTEIASKFLIRNGNTGVCNIDPSSNCKHIQDNYDVGNYIRHCRSKHTEVAIAKGLGKDESDVPKRPRVAAKRPIAVDKQLFVDSAIKMVAYHNMPLTCFEWEGIKQLFDPIAAAVGVCINRSNIKGHLKMAYDMIHDYIKNEVRGKLLSIKIDSASRYTRSVLGIIAQYTVDGVVVVRTLGKYYVCSANGFCPC